MTRRRNLAVAAAPALLMVLANSLITYFTDVRTSQMVNDPAATLEYPAYIGIFSYLSVALWIAAAAIGIFGWRVLRDHSPAGGRFLRDAGLLSGWMTLDDLFLVHERLVPTYVGPPEAAVYAAEGAVALAILIRHRALAPGPGRELLILAGVAFGLSLMADLWDPSGLDVLVEDALKVLGVAAWLGFLVVRASRLLQPAAPSPLPRSMEAP